MPFQTDPRLTPPDALVNNLFKRNATVIDESATASHVEGQGTRKAKPAAGGGAPAPNPNP